MLACFAIKGSGAYNQPHNIFTFNNLYNFH